MKNVYRFYVDYGRGYEVQGMFVATPEEVTADIGKTASFGEVCGKHSDMNVDLEEGHFRAIEASPEVIAFVEKELGGGSGYNPLDYVRCEGCCETSGWCSCDEEKG